MKAFINGRTVFGTPIKAIPPVYPSQMVSTWSHFFVLCWNHSALNMWSVFICHRSISLILKFSLREKLLPMTVAAAFVARLATSWKTAPCVKSRENQNTCLNLTKCFSATWANCAFVPRSKQRKEMERRPEHLRDKSDTGEDAKDQVRQRSEHWRKRDALEIRCCYLCGSSAHIKKDCQLYRSPAGSSKVTSYSRTGFLIFFSFPHNLKL